MKLKVFETEIDFEYKFDPNTCELSLLCEDKSGQIYTFNEIEHEISNMNFRKYNLIFQKKIIKKSGMIEKTIKKYPFDNVKKWFGIYFYDPKLFPINTPLKEINMYFDFSEYLQLTKRDLTDQEINEIVETSSHSKRMINIYEFLKIINLGYTKIIDKINQNLLIKIGKLMVLKNEVNLELFKKIKVCGSNQVIWIIKNQLYPLLNIGIYSKKNWIEAKDILVRNIHRILPFIEKRTFDIIDPIIEWTKYKEKKPDELMYMIKGNIYGANYQIIPKYFNNNTDQEVMKEIYKRFYEDNSDNDDILDAQSDFCYRISKIKNINNVEDVKKIIELWKKVEYAIS